jgi:hypothetical protein
VHRPPAFGLAGATTAAGATLRLPLIAATLAAGGRVAQALFLVKGPLTGREHELLPAIHACQILIARHDSTHASVQKG